MNDYEVTLSTDFSRMTILVKADTTAQAFFNAQQDERAQSFLEGHKGFFGITVQPSQVDKFVLEIITKN